jgi:hypothetical protein
MARIRLFTRSTRPGAEWAEHWGELPRVPAVDDYVAPGAVLGEQTAWYRVHVVVPTPDEGDSCQAQVFAMRTDHPGAPRRPQPEIT